MKVSYLPVYDLWDELETKEYESTEMKLISRKESQTIEKITALYSNGIKTTITDSDTLHKIALELRENLTVQDRTSDWKAAKEHGVPVTLLLKNGDTIELEYFSEYILSDRFPDSKVILELPTLKNTLEQEMNTEL